MLSLRDAASTPRLLVATDFDGTLAPLQDDPETVEPLPAAVSALSTLCRVPETHVCVISGRSLTDLWRRIPAIPGLLLRGSYGSEVHSPASQPRPGSDLDRLHAILTRATHGTHARLERKTMGVAVHTRGLPRKEADNALTAARRAALEVQGLREFPGIDVLDFSFSAYDKATALREEIELFAPTTVVVIGDDAEDEKMFAAARPRALTIKVGDTATRAEFSVPSPHAATQALAKLSEFRTLWATEHF
ncbi:MAG: trehalose-phosphatase [Phycisphaerales bacterium]